MHVHRVEIGFIIWNQCLLKYYSDSWALISCQTWVYLTVYALNTLKIPDQIHHHNASCNILHIYFNGSEITTCLTSNQVYDKKKNSILSEVWSQVLRAGRRARFVHIKSHVTLHVNSCSMRHVTRCFVRSGAWRPTATYPKLAWNLLARIFNFLACLYVLWLLIEQKILPLTLK